MTTLLTQKLLSHKIIEKGEFKLKSGKMSNFYVNLKKLPSHPSLMREICDNFVEKIDLSNIDLIAPVPYGAIPLATHISHLSNIPMVILRKEMKDYGSTDIPNNIYDKRVLLLEDVVTTGSSIKEFLGILANRGIPVLKIASIIDRSENESIFPKCYDYETLLKLDDFSNIDKYKNKKYVLRKLIQQKKSNICYAADLDSLEEVCKVAEIIGDYICILKLHCDIYNDFSMDKIEKLKKIAKKYNFLIWEDRKFADIGKIMNRQLKDGVYNISKWADIVSIHSISGYESLKYVIENNNIDFFVISELSAYKNLIDEKYTSDTLKIIKSFDNVSGVVCQNDLQTDALKIIPGVSWSRRDLVIDGQSYRGLDEKKYADILVFGNTITNAIKHEENFEEYMDELRSACYMNYIINNNLHDNIETYV